MHIWLPLILTALAVLINLRDQSRVRRFVLPAILVMFAMPASDSIGPLVLAGTAIAGGRIIMSRRALEAPRRRGLEGEQKVGDLLDAVAARATGKGYRVRVESNVELVTRDGREGDADYVVLVEDDTGQPAYFIQIEVKSQAPDAAHLKQANMNSERLSRLKYGRLPYYTLVVHPNSNEPVEFDERYGGVARMGLGYMSPYVMAILRGEMKSRQRKLPRRRSK